MRRPDKRKLAAPFVVTASLSAGAMAQPKPLPDAPAGWRVEHSGTGECFAFHMNFKCPPPPTTCNPPPPKRVRCPPVAPKDPEQVVRRADGTCYEDLPADCPPTKVCDAPPRIEVFCPPVVPPKLEGEVVRSPDGTCTLVVRSTCPPGARCNPPPPRKVECPPQ